MHKYESTTGWKGLQYDILFVYVQMDQPQGSTTCETGLELASIVYNLNKGFTMFAYVFNAHDGFTTAHEGTTAYMTILKRVH